ncbi:MAG: ATP-binding cassette domain-containing protein [Pseudobacteriovorax sp.]|nr:ATP-binding cassette domain-containing protein [Pseudobacteriovorax sp.]
MINLSHISKSFGDTEVINDISFRVQAGERISLLGPGGCGKSTLLKLVLGLEEVDEGTIELFETEMTSANVKTRQDVLRRVGVAFQQGGLFDFMTVDENIRFAMDNMTEMSQAEMDEKIIYLLTKVKLPKTRTMFPYELSGGMKRRIGIARALATDPDVAIFDEPTSGLDPVTSTIILNMIGDMGDEKPNSSLIVSTSSVEVAIRFSSRVVLMREGKVTADDDWRKLIVEGDEWVRNFLGTRLIGIDINYAKELGLPKAFIDQHWS